MAKLYIESKGGLLAGDTAATAARLLVSLEGGENVSVSHDENGTYFELTNEQLDAFLAQADGAPKKKRRGRAAKPAEAAEETEAPEPDSEDSEDPDIQE